LAGLYITLHAFKKLKFNLASISFVFLVFCSCGRETKGLTYVSSEKVALNLIQVCVDSTLQLDRELNTGKYLVDFSMVKGLNRKGINSFLQHNGNASEANLDSLILHDSTWVRYQFFQNPVIRFDKIQVQPDGTILINMSKTKASDGAIGTEMILQRQGENVKCILNRISRIS